MHGVLNALGSAAEDSQSDYSQRRTYSSTKTHQGWLYVGRFISFPYVEDQESITIIQLAAPAFSTHYSVSAGGRPHPCRRHDNAGVASIFNYNWLELVEDRLPRTPVSPHAHPAPDTLQSTQYRMIPNNLVHLNTGVEFLSNWLF